MSLAPRPRESRRSSAGVGVGAGVGGSRCRSSANDRLKRFSQPGMNESQDEVSKPDQPQVKDVLESPRKSVMDRLFRPNNLLFVGCASGRRNVPASSLSVPDANANEKRVNYDPTQPCICNRPLKRVICRICGFYTEGRVRKFCLAHPMDLYLLDVSACPAVNCGANPIHLLEHDFPEGKALQKTQNKKI